MKKDAKNLGSAAQEPHLKTVKEETKMNDENEKLVWNMLLLEIGNPYGVAGLMGNLMAESSMNPFCKTGGKGDIRKLSSVEYVSRIMSREYSKYNFAHDGVAFGLVQWAYYSRKDALYDYAMSHKLNIASIQAQVGHMLQELPKYKTVWKTLKETKSINEASDIVLLRYEKPADVSDKAKAKRALYAQQFYDKYANQPKMLSIPEMIDILEDIEEHEMLQIDRRDNLALVIADLSEMTKGES